MTIRELMGNDGILLAPGIYDALSGLIATQTGAKAVYLSGASLAYTALDAPILALSACPR